MSADKVYTEDEVAKHNTKEDCWVIIGNDKTGGRKVYDVTKYLDDHPGGPEIIQDYAGKDADDMFEDIGHSKGARETLATLCIGSLKEDPNAVKKKADKKAKIESKGGLNPLAVLLLIAAIALGYYFSQVKQN
jgi:cytochrome b involved in lipid metabolism